MKSNVNFFFALILGMGLFFTSCQDEVVDITPPDEQEVISAGSSLSTLMSSASANYGAADDVLDNSSCFSVELPVTIVAGNVTITIEDLDDLEDLVEFLEDFEGQDDIFDFVFPITLIFNDYTEIVIENEEELENLVDQCVDDTDADDVIDCIDFVYPISFSVFNQDFILVDTIVVENDEALYEFLDSLDDENQALIVSLNYPVSLIYGNGEIIEVNSNEELAEAIELVSQDCGDYGDDDDDEVCNEEVLAANLTECLWVIDDEFNDFDEYYINFSPDGTLEILGAPTVDLITGDWELNSTDSGLVLNLSNVSEFGEFFNGEWSIVECEGDELYIVKGDFMLELEKECDNSSECDPYVLGEILPICEWDIELYTANSEFEEFSLDFSEDGTFIISQNGDLISDDGTWNLEVTGTGGILSLAVPGVDLGGDWVLIECDFDGSFEFAFQNGDNIMVLEKNCDGNNNGLFECFESFEADIVICDEGTDGPYEVDLTVVFANCQADTITFFETEEDAVNFVNPISNPSAYSVIDTETTVYAKVEINNEYAIFDIDIYIEDCGNDTCSEGAISDYLQTCTWIPVSYNGDDNLIDYTMVFGAETLTIEGNGVTATTTYSVQGDNPTFVFINGINLPDIQAIGGDWTVASCEPDRIVLLRNNDILILEQDCN